MDKEFEDLKEKVYDLLYDVVYFEFNNEVTRNKFVSACFGYGITVRCDENLNTPEIIDDNAFVYELLYNENWYKFKLCRKMILEEN